MFYKSWDILPPCYISFSICELRTQTVEALQVELFQLQLLNSSGFLLSYVMLDNAPHILND